VLSRLKIAVRINLLLALAAFGILLNAGLELWAMRTHMFEDKRIELTRLMDLVLNDARGHMERLGGTKTEAGRGAFFDTIRSAKFGDRPTNYFFIYDYDGLAVLHPDPSTQGRNRFDAIYSNGLKMVPKFIEIAKSSPLGGFAEYDRPDEAGILTPKISHLREVPELKVVLGVGAHIEDINAAFLERLHFMALLFVLSMLAIGSVGFVISHSIRAPLSNAVDKITRLANGDLDIAPANPDEKSELGEVDKALDVLRANAIERQALQEALHESEQRLKLALAAGAVGTWELTLGTGEFMTSDLALVLLSVPPGTTLTLEKVLERVHPDDRHLLQDALLNALATGETYRLEWRTQLPDNSIRWLETLGERRSIAGKEVVAGTIQDITRKVDQKEAVERAAKAESEFLSSMSHELRTPMHAILGYTEMCKQTVKEGKTDGIEKYLNNVTTSGKRLLHLLNHLLDLAKMEEGRMEYRFERADLKDVVDHTLMELDPLIKAKNLQMHVTYGERTDALFDRNHLIQVLINLVSNAIKFSNAGSEIGIELSEHCESGGEPTIRCKVVDDGPGIPEEELKAVFDKFVQSKKSKSGNGGTGLGLAICDHIVKAHKGRIWAENAMPHGAAFTFVIPRGNVAECAVNAAQA
jgi:signal transduction histidine kinase